MVDALGGGRWVRDGYVHGRIERIPGKGFDRGRDGGRKEHGLPIRRQALEDFVDFLGESHVEHPVRFVDNEYFEFREIRRFPLHVIQEAAGGGDNDFRTLEKGFYLGLVIDPSVYQPNPGGQVFPQNFKMFGHLDGEFAGGGQDQDPGPGASDHLLEGGQGEGGCFSRSRLDAADDVCALEGHGDRPLLDGGGFGKPHFVNCVKELGEESERAE